MASLAIVGTIVLLICFASVLGFLKRRSRASTVQLAGSGLLLVMVLTHVAEHFHLLMTMRWGSPDSIGHYLDLVSAVGGVCLLGGGYIMKLME
jgi:choline-glycine betaine transporter